MTSFFRVLESDLTRHKTQLWKLQTEEGLITQLVSQLPRFVARLFMQAVLQLRGKVELVAIAIQYWNHQTATSVFLIDTWFSKSYKPASFAMGPDVDERCCILCFGCDRWQKRFTRLDVLLLNNLLGGFYGFWWGYYLSPPQLFQWHWLCNYCKTLQKNIWPPTQL